MNWHGISFIRDYLLDTYISGAQPGGRGEASLALNKEEKFVPEFSLKDYEILTNEH